ncbi:acyl-CoA synthetase (AMP-forming)/AMP-acid ligase II [Jatrophihabitans sp. GAS493]|uniref:AMP-binding protein n=1 Tax=Jatrophihabitans sp. GAS493 TaxID=1907575 RepID=UPI000BB8D31B|nr:AMP-binding protein [Jatrophihabitans sp. GAS493]SOD72160.1 acyl-CoA synthetase (AMP-forming)/AMP-acid ligase II [Jatrophihabitans sp. GAS493]
MANFNFARLIEAVADQAPDRIAVSASDGTSYSYGELDVRGNRFGHTLMSLGAGYGDRVAILAHNRAEWLDVMIGCFKLGALIVNVNYRYTAGEIAHVLRDSGAAVVVAEAEFAGVLHDALQQAGTSPRILFLDQDAPEESAYSARVASADAGRDFPPHEGVDEYLLYTGGTTGLPKGVVWTQEDLVNGAVAYGWAVGGTGFTDPSAIAQRLTEEVPVVMAVAPLMHGNGQWAMLRAWTLAGTAAIWAGRRFEADKLLDSLERMQVNIVSLVGDSMAKPLLAEIERDPNRWDLSALSAIGSGGAVMSPQTKAAIRRMLPHVTVIDGYGGSEFGTAGTLTGEDDATFPRFDAAADRVQVVRDDLSPVTAGEQGLVAVGGAVASRYWNDPVKSAQVFRVDGTGKRWATPGDSAIRNSDGTFSLLGRGSLAINTGGEKVYPDEVETALKTYPAIRDALVVGVPDPLYGQRIAAVVSRNESAEGVYGADLSVAQLQDHLRSRLAGFKIPRLVAVVSEIRRSPAGKADYLWARQQVTQDAITTSGSTK